MYASDTLAALHYAEQLDAVESHGPAAAADLERLETELEQPGPEAAAVARVIQGVSADADEAAAGGGADEPAPLAGE